MSFEITCEHALDQVKAVQKLMELLRREGCRFILARFDGGEAAFGLLRQLKPEFVKLSPGLVRMLGQGRIGSDHLRAIHGACHTLGIKTIAEHVESEQTIADLRALGVDYGQGFAIEAPHALT